MSANPRPRLMNPGPVTLSPGVRAALLRDDLCHREPEFARLQRDVTERLTAVYPERRDAYAAVLLTGSGTTAVEAMLTSLVPPSGRPLVLVNGVYGERIVEILRRHARNPAVLRMGWTEALDLVRLEGMLARESGITHVVAVHHETTTGRLNDPAPLGAVCRRRDVALLLDAVSSFGGEQLELDAWGVEACAATANKCLHGAPGICFVVARRRMLEERVHDAVPLSLDLFRHYAEQAAGRPLFTPAVQVLYGLQQALRELEERGGWSARRSHYLALSGKLRNGLRRNGLKLLLGSDADYSAALTSFVLPEGLPFDVMHDWLKAQGFIIYPGQQVFRDAMFRVAVMGDLTSADLDEFLAAYAELLHFTGFEGVAGGHSS